MMDKNSDSLGLNEKIPDYDEKDGYGNKMNTFPFISMYPPISVDPDHMDDEQQNIVNSINSYLEIKMTQGFDLAKNIKSNKDYGNPLLLTKVVDHYSIDEIGSNYPKDIYDPHGYQDLDFEESIRKRNSNSTSTIVNNNNNSMMTSSQDVLQSLQQRGVPISMIPS